MNIFLNEYFGFCFELNFELNHFYARFNEKMNFQNVSNRATLTKSLDPPSDMVKLRSYVDVRIHTDDVVGNLLLILMAVCC